MRISDWSSYVCSSDLFGAMLSVGGQIDSIEKFVADETVYTFNPRTGRANGDYSNWMGQKVWLGGAMASALALQLGATPPPGWTSQHKLSGIAHALWAVRYDAKGDHFAAGVPAPQWIGQWEIGRASWRARVVPDG